LIRHARAGNRLAFVPRSSDSRAALMDIQRRPKTTMIDDGRAAVDLIFREMMAIFQSTDGMEMGVEERLRLCANAVALALRQAGFGSNRQ